MTSEEAVICQGLIVSNFFFLASFQVLLGRFDNETSKNAERWNTLEVLVQIIYFLAMWPWACHFSLGLTFFHLDNQMIQHHLLKIPSFPHCITVTPLSYIRCVCRSISELIFPFYCSIYSSLHLFRRDLTKQAWGCYSLRGQHIRLVVGWSVGT